MNHRNAYSADQFRVLRLDAVRELFTGEEQV